MIETQYHAEVAIQLPDDLLPFRSEAVKDILAGLGVVEVEPTPAVS